MLLDHQETITKYNKEMTRVNLFYVREVGLCWEKAALLTLIDLLCENELGLCWAGYEKLMKSLNISKDNYKIFKNNLYKLKKYGLIHILSTSSKLKSTSQDLYIISLVICPDHPWKDKKFEDVENEIMCFEKEQFKKYTKSSRASENVSEASENARIMPLSISNTSLAHPYQYTPKKTNTDQNSKIENHGKNLTPKPDLSDCVIDEDNLLGRLARGSKRPTSKKQLKTWITEYGYQVVKEAVENGEKISNMANLGGFVNSELLKIKESNKHIEQAKSAEIDKKARNEASERNWNIQNEWWKERYRDFENSVNTTKKISDHLMEELKNLIESYPTRSIHLSFKTDFFNSGVTPKHFKAWVDGYNKRQENHKNEDIEAKDNKTYTDHLTRPEFGHDADKDDGENRSAAPSPTTPSMSSSPSESSTKPVTEKSTALLALKDKLLATVTEKLESRRANENLNTGENRLVQQNDKTHTISPASLLSQKNSNVGIKSVGIKLSKKCSEIYQLIKTHPGERLPFYAAKINVHPHTLERSLKKLKDLNIVEHRGCKKTGGYYVVPA